MKKIIFVTGNQNKADYLAKFLDHPIDHKKIDLDEIQSLDLKEIIEHKVRQAYKKIKRPVIVEDTSLEFKSLGGLPGPFIRFFVDNMKFEDICSLVNGKDRGAVAKCAIGYFDGKILKIFEKKMMGEIAQKPAGENGFGWDKIFIPKGYNITRSSLNDIGYQKTYLKIKPLVQLKKFLKENNL
ncbi:MAG: Ham1 family protein [Candidatus Moranbacteria bacterium GW2011_GWF2_34_56]|nr:MAG: Ham1 family protein [Candidatus Moranbacteria bacterium GW2011_GWF1_34_10]KKP64440.1 MAG: Ham1 family protein [Candidatus Moranbacteria bacterium GW2011_GWF2_34_56]HBI17088.1 non-canonical purine NTP pyrophosphatase [Candidatus Moranbacteria bacterium]